MINAVSNEQSTYSYVKPYQWCYIIKAVKFEKLIKEEERDLFLVE